MLKNKKSFMAILSLALLLAMACGAWAALSPNADGVYEIGTAEELAAFREMVNAGSNDIDGKLTADITLPNEPWMPIGTFLESVPGGGYDIDYLYRGTFDGNGKTIANLVGRPDKVVVAYSSGSRGFGLFGGLSGDAVVQNLVISSVDIDLSAVEFPINSGAVVGIIASGTVKNCGVIGGPNGRILGGNVGGIAGIAVYTGIIDGCYVRDFVLLDGDYTYSPKATNVGGIIGGNYRNSQVLNCFVSNIDVIKGSGVGGIVGVNYDFGAANKPIISNCYVEAVGEISSWGVQTTEAAGGICGVSDAAGEIKNCVFVDSSVNTIISSDIQEGGVLGRVSGGSANLSVVQDCSYPNENITFSHSVDSPIGNIDVDDMDPQYNVSSYDVTSSDNDLPAIAAALAEYTVSLEIGGTYTLVASTFPGKAGDFACAWSTEDASVANIVGDELSVTLTGVAVGTTSVTAKIRGSINADLTCMVNVTEKSEPANEVTPEISGGDPENIAPNEEVEIIYDFGDENEVTIFDGSGLSVSVDDSGNVVLEGTATAEPGNYSFEVEITDEEGRKIVQEMPVTVAAPHTASGTQEDGKIESGMEVEQTHDFGDDYKAVDVDGSGLNGSGLTVSIDADGNVVLEGTATNPGEYFYEVTLERPDGSTFTQKVPVIVEAESTQQAYGGGGSSNCNAGLGFGALLSLLGMAVVQKRK